MMKIPIPYYIIINVLNVNILPSIFTYITFISSKVSSNFQTSLGSYKVVYRC